MADSIFTKIINGDITSHRIYEDELTYAFLDIHPNVPGHTLVIPKKQIEYIWDLPGDDYQAVMATAKKVAIRMKEVLKPKWVGMKVEGIAVPHAHVHVFPFNSLEEYHRQTPEDFFVPDTELAEMAKKLAF
ncbi:HIT domain-containing protein [Candidatus Saccharibacteria bacterium]|nr:HIT domain-containing protein [Candidatus Saccharibacteria bacterium]